VAEPPNELHKHNERGEMMPKFKVYLRPDVLGGQRHEEVEADGGYVSEGALYLHRVVEDGDGNKAERPVMIFASSAWERIERLG
jgi:hypothetical protein